MRNKTVLLLLIAFLTVAAGAALPPQTTEELTTNADYIFEGEVISVNSSLAKVKNGEDRRYVLTVRISEWSKGKITVENPVRVHCRTTENRPTGWAGPQGQNEIPKVGEVGKFYVKKGFKLLEPNGWHRTVGS